MFSRSLKVRLATFFTFVLLLGAGALYAVTYILLSSSLQQDERRLLQAKLLEFWAVYQTGRTVAVQREFTLDKFFSESTAFFVRIADPENRTITGFEPSSWDTSTLEDIAPDELADGNTFGRISAGSGGPSLTFASIRLSDGNYLQVGVSNGRRIELLAKLRSVYLLVAIPFLAVGIVGAWLAASRALVPVKKLSTMSRFIIDTGSLSRRIPATGTRDELDELTGLFNKMIARIEVLVDGMRRSLDDVGHDLRTPMTRLRMRAEEALANLSDREAAERALSAIVTETEQMLTMLKTLMDISQAESGVMRLERERVDLARLVEDIAELYSYTASEKEITVETSLGERLDAMVDVNRFRQVVANLLDNAVKYTPPGGRVAVRGWNEGETVAIEVADTGIGICEEDLPHIWERLYRADRSRSNPGLGLGLGLVKAIVEAHGGSVGVSSTPDAGSVFTVVMPGDDRSDSGISASRRVSADRGSLPPF
jgi:signal transduction histidine kinase